MKFVSANCPRCGAKLEIAQGQESTYCQFCGTKIFVDDGSTKVKVNYNDAESAGYAFEKGRQKAQREQWNRDHVITPGPSTSIQNTPVNNSSPQFKHAEHPKKRKTWLWVLGWIFLWPAALTALMFKSPKTANINKKVRIAIVVAAWLICFGWTVFVASSENSTNSTDANTSNSTTEQTSNINTSGYVNINKFIDKFNSTSGLTITNIQEVSNVSSKESPYYRTEYRTNAFNNAVATIGTIEGYGQIDIISYGSSGYTNIRVYADADTNEKAAILFEKIANVLVSESDKKNISDCVDRINEGMAPSSMYLGSKYSAGYSDNEVLIEAIDVSL